MSLLEFIKPTNYLNAYAASAGDASSDNSVWSATGTAMVINQKTASLLNVGKNTRIEAHGTPSADSQSNGNLIVRSNALNESLVLGGKARRYSVFRYRIWKKPARSVLRWFTTS